MTTPVHLVEIDAFRSGSVVLAGVYGIGARPIGALSLDAAVDETIFRLADREYTSRSADPIGVQAYRGLVLAALRGEREIPLDPGAAAVVGASWGEIEVANPDGYWRDLVDDYAIDGRAVRVLRGAFAFDRARGLWVDPAYVTFEELFRGIALGWRLDADGLRIEVRDRTLKIERTYQQAYYAGTGGLDGDSDLTGVALPVVRGTVLNVTPRLVDAAKRIYQYTDGGGTIVGGPYERGVAGFTDEGDVSDLYAGTTSAGAVRTDDAKGLFQLGSDPVGEITVDVTGNFPTAGFKGTAAAIARYMLQEDLGLGASVLDTGSFDDLDTAYPYDAGIAVGPDAADAAEAVGFVLRSIGAVLVPARDSRLKAIRLAAASGAPATTFDESAIVRATAVRLPENVSPPNYRRAVGYRRNWTVQTPDLDAAVPNDRRQFLAQAWRSAAWFDGDVRMRHLRATDPPMIETALADKADAEALAGDHGSLWGVERRAYEVEIPEQSPTWDIGDTVRVDFPLGALASAPLAVVYGESWSLGEGVMRLRVLV